MKITTKGNLPLCYFDELEIGDVFFEKTGGEDVFQMKMECCQTGCANFNAVDLASGEIYEVEGDAFVYRVNAELIITNVMP